jgi:hypothetical protein
LPASFSSSRVLRGVARRALRLIGMAAPAAPDRAAAMAVRRAFAEKYIKGAGIEIGALSEPLWVPAGAKVTYVDRMAASDLRRHYPELDTLPLVEVDLIDDGERLGKVADSSQDFMISNHFLEHTQDPIGTLARHLAVLKPGGVLYMAVPDKRQTFDSKRPETTFEHLVRDWREGSAWSYEGHLREYAALVDGLSGAALEARIAFLRRTGYSIHFHVWTGATLADFLTRLDRDLHLPLKLEEMVANAGRQENICVIRRR